MKLYLVSPAIPVDADPALVNDRLAACIEPIADLILSHLAPDPALFGMRGVDDVTDSPLGAGDRYAGAEVARIPDDASLRRVLLACGDPNSGQWMLIRSVATCRTVRYGFDGQAYVCLPESADPIVSPDEDLIDVVECSHLLVETDLLDGILID